MEFAREPRLESHGIDAHVVAHDDEERTFERNGLLVGSGRLLPGSRTVETHLVLGHRNGGLGELLHGDPRPGHRKEPFEPVLLRKRFKAHVGGEVKFRHRRDREAQGLALYRHLCAPGLKRLPRGVPRDVHFALRGLEQTFEHGIPSAEAKRHVTREHFEGKFRTVDARVADPRLARERGRRQCPAEAKVAEDDAFGLFASREERIHHRDRQVLHPQGPVQFLFAERLRHRGRPRDSAVSGDVEKPVERNPFFAQLASHGEGVESKHKVLFGHPDRPLETDGFERHAPLRNARKARRNREVRRSLHDAFEERSAGKFVAQPTEIEALESKPYGEGLLSAQVHIGRAGKTHLGAFVAPTVRAHAQGLIGVAIAKRHTLGELHVARGRLKSRARDAPFPGRGVAQKVARKLHLAAHGLARPGERQVVLSFLAAQTGVRFGERHARNREVVGREGDVPHHFLPLRDPAFEAQALQGVVGERQVRRADVDVENREGRTPFEMEVPFGAAGRPGNRPAEVGRVDRRLDVEALLAVGDLHFAVQVHRIDAELQIEPGREETPVARHPEGALESERRLLNRALEVDARERRGPLRTLDDAFGLHVARKPDRRLREDERARVEPLDLEVRLPAHGVAPVDVAREDGRTAVGRKRERGERCREFRPLPFHREVALGDLVDLQVRAGLERVVDGRPREFEVDVRKRQDVLRKARASHRERQRKSRLGGRSFARHVEFDRRG